jgi:predicted permease
LPRLDAVKVDLGTLGFVGSLTLLTSLVFSLIPLLRASRKRTHESLKIEGRSTSAGRSKRRLGQIFIVCEYVFSLVLLILGASLVENFLKLQHADPGFDSNHLLVFRITVPDVNYGTFIYGQKSPARERLYEQLEQVVDAVPGVESAALSERLPMQASVNPSGVQIAGHAIPPSGSEGDTSTEMVNPAFMHALRLKLIRGRFLDQHDSATAPMAAVVNESFVRTFLPNEDPIGKRANVWYAHATIVGVIADFKFNGLDRKPFPEIFWSLQQSPGRNVWIMARSLSDPSLVAEGVRQKIHAFDPDLPVLEMQPMTEVIADSLWLKRLSADLLGLVAALAIVLAGAGIYGVMSYSVSLRMKEMGIRMAFGASRRNVFGLIMAETCRLALLGSALGFVAAFIASRLATSTVYLAPSLASTQSKDSLNPASFVVSSLFLFAIAICASYAPARRALRVDPGAVLQHE